MTTTSQWIRSTTLSAMIAAALLWAGRAIATNFSDCEGPSNVPIGPCGGIVDCDQLNQCRPAYNAPVTCGNGTVCYYFAATRTLQYGRCEGDVDPGQVDPEHPEPCFKCNNYWCSEGWLFESIFAGNCQDPGCQALSARAGKCVPPS